MGASTEWGDDYRDEINIDGINMKFNWGSDLTIDFGFKGVDQDSNLAITKYYHHAWHESWGFTGLIEEDPLPGAFKKNGV